MKRDIGAWPLWHRKDNASVICLRPDIQRSSELERRMQVLDKPETADQLGMGCVQPDIGWRRGL
jgi:hypothetical protein